MTWKVYMMDMQGKYKNKEEAIDRKEALERTYKGSRITFELREE